MLYLTAGQDASIYVPFMVDGEFVVPDNGSAKYTLRDNAGAAVAGHTDQAIGTTTSTTSVQLALPGSVNSITGEMEKRRLEVVFSAGGKPFQWSVSYRLINYLNMTAVPEDVRRMLGVQRKELPDEDVDLVEAYFAVNDKVEDLEAALQDASQMMAANRAIVATAALRAIPSLQLRVSQAEGTDTTTWQRLKGIDFDRLRADITDMLGDDLLAFSGGVAIDPTLAVFGEDTDPITGA